MSRVGPHVLNESAAVYEWCRRAAIVKSMGPLDALRIAPPDAIRIYRRFFADQNLDRDGAAIARDVIDALQGYRHPNLYIELYNEPGSDHVDKLVRIHNEAAPICREAGVKLSGPCWSSGSYERSHWRQFFDGTRGNVALANIHGYWSRLYGPTIFNAWRYEQFWQPGDPDVVISEAGEDEVRDGPGGVMVGRAGYLLNGTPPDVFLGEIDAFEAELDPHVVGAVIFAGGTSYDWRYFETDSLDTSRYSIGRKPAVVTLGNGFKRAISAGLLNPPAEGEIYHFAGSNDETSMAVGGDGYMTWRKDTNETTVVRDDGAVYSDNGNRGDGQFKRLR